MSNQIILVDANNLMYRTHFTHTNLTDHRGYPTGIIHGMLSNVLSIAKKYPDSHQIFCWDKGQSWRTALAPKVYKANRVRNEDVTKAVGVQMPLVKSVLQRFGFHQLSMSSIEADDWISALASAFASELSTREVYIYSGDRDFYQCITNKVTVLKPTKTGLQAVTPNSVEKEFGVVPVQYTLLRALAGDSSDNYKPVPGIGDKKALAYIMSGIDPRLPNFSDHPQTVRMRAMKLKSFWPEIHNCWKMCILPPAHMPKTEADALRTLVRRVVVSPSRKVLSSEEKQRVRKWFYDFTMTYDLAELSRKQDDFWLLR